MKDEYDKKKELQKMKINNLDKIIKIKLNIMKMKLIFIKLKMEIKK